MSLQDFSGISIPPGTLIDPTCPVNWEHPLNQGRVGWWKVVANSGWRGGLTWRDLVRGGGHSPHDGTLTNFSPPVSGWSGYGPPQSSGAIKFVAASSQYVDLGANFDGTADMTVSAWVKPASLGVRHEIVSAEGLTPCGWELSILATNNVEFGAFNPGSSSAGYPVVQSVATLAANTWYFVVGVRDSIAGLLRIYINGTQSATAAASLSPSSSGKTATIGRSQSGSTRYFDGSIGDVSIWLNRALSAQEIASLYALSRQGYPGVLNYLTPVEYSFPSAATFAGYEDEGIQYQPGLYQW